MTETRPWLDTGDTPPHLRDLLREARASQPLDARTRARSRRRVVAMSALPAAAGVVFWVKNIALGAVLGGTVLAVAYVPKFGASADEPDVAAQQPAAKATRSRGYVPMPHDASVEDSGATAPTVPAVTAPARPSVAAARSAEPSQLSRETQMLEQARGLMRLDARRALFALTAHRREFPHGALELERELLAVDALLRLGQRQDAERRAAQLRAQAPGSIYEQRLTRLLGEGAN